MSKTTKIIGVFLMVFQIRAHCFIRLFKPAGCRPLALYNTPCIFLGTPLESTEKQVSKAEHTSSLQILAKDRKPPKISVFSLREASAAQSAISHFKKKKKKV